VVRLKAIKSVVIKFYSMKKITVFFIVSLIKWKSKRYFDHCNDCLLQFEGRRGAEVSGYDSLLVNVC